MNDLSIYTNFLSLTNGEKQRFKDNRLGFRAFRTTGNTRLDILPYYAQGWWFVVITDTETGTQTLTEQAIYTDEIDTFLKYNNAFEGFGCFEPVPYEPPKPPK